MAALSEGSSCRGLLTTLTVLSKPLRVDPPLTRDGGLDLPEGEKESSKWLKGLNAINQQASQWSKRFVTVEDRQGDVFSFKAQRKTTVDLLVRLYQARNIVCQLPDVSSPLPDYTVPVYKL